MTFLKNTIEKNLRLKNQFHKNNYTKKVII